MGITCLVTLLFCLAVPAARGLDFAYLDHEQLTSFLEDIHEEFPDITHLYSAGKSVQGRDLWVMAMGKNPTEHTLLQPEIKYVGTVHGNELLSRVVLIHLIDLLTRSYGVNDTITDLLDRSRVHIMVALNPDGCELALKNGTEGECFDTFGRYNGDGFDLNRNFPDYFEENPNPIQPETQAVMDWLKEYQFVLSANLHGGAVVANYPYDNYFLKDDCEGLFCYAGDLDMSNCSCQCPVDATQEDCDMYYSKSWRGSLPAICPDDDIFQQISKVYSYHHGNMRTIGCRKSNTTVYSFPPDGITNGAEWYPLTGGMQDYNYIEGGCLEVTLELSCCKWPMTDELEGHWEDNRHSLVAYLLEGLKGVKGIVKDADGNPVKGATVKIVGREQHPTKTTAAGEYWRLLVPGQYKIKITAPDFKTITTDATVDSGSYATEVQIDMDPSAGCNLVPGAFLLVAAILSYAF